MIKIIQFRPFELKEGTLQFVKSIKPFEDAGLVYNLPNSIKEEMDLLYDVCNDFTTGHYGFSDILNCEKKTETPSTLFNHIHNRDETLPTLWAYREHKGKRTGFVTIRDYHQLQSLLSVATERGYVQSDQKAKVNKS